MSVLYDAPGQQRWITVEETARARYLLLDDCEEGAMDLSTEEPLFDYLWFHKCSGLGGRPVRKALVLGAGAFTLPKGLALDYPDAWIEAVDSEPDLERIGRQFFRLDHPEFARIRFTGAPAEAFLGGPAGVYDFIFDDLFDDFQQVPEVSLGREYFQLLRQVLAPGGTLVKNMIWDTHAKDTQSACRQARAALEAVFPQHGLIALGGSNQGHNLLLIGWKAPAAFVWEEARAHLAGKGVPESVLRQTRQVEGGRGSE